MENHEIITFINSTDALFHYTSRVNAIDYILSTGSLRLSPFYRTNDPLEYKDWMIGITGGLLKDNENKLFLNLESIYNTIIKNKTFFLSFSENRINKSVKTQGYNRSRMWSQYAEHHKGVCLVFSEKKILEEANKEKTPRNIIIIDSVCYKNNLPEKGFVLNKKILNNHNLTQKVFEFIERNIKNILFVKAKDYYHESEKRLVYIDPEETKEFKFFNIIGSLKAIWRDIIKVQYSNARKYT